MIRLEDSSLEYMWREMLVVRVDGDLNRFCKLYIIFKRED